MKQFRSLTAAFSRLNTIHKDIFPSQTSISTIISIISTALLFGAYSSTWKSRTSQEDYTHIPFSYDYKTLPRYNLNLPRLIFTNDKMTFFGKHTIVHKVVGSIKKEPSRYERLQINEKETSPLLAEKHQRKTDRVRTFTAQELADYTDRAAMFHHMAMRS